MIPYIVDFNLSLFVIIPKVSIWNIYKMSVYIYLIYISRYENKCPLASPTKFNRAVETNTCDWNPAVQISFVPFDKLVDSIFLLLFGL